MNDKPRDQPPPARAAFGRELAHWRALREKTQAGLARRLVEERWLDECHQSYVAHVEAGRKPPPKGIAEGADAILETGGVLMRLWPWVDLERECEGAGRLNGLSRDKPASTIVGGSDAGRQEASAVPTRREMFGYLRTGVVAAGLERAMAGVRRVAPGLVEALETSRQAGASSLAPGTVEQLHTAIDHYTIVFPTRPANELYVEVLNVRQWVGSLLEAKLTLNEHCELVVAAGWLSLLLSLLAFDRGEQASARVWCDDGRDRGMEAGHLELAAFSREPLASMAFYSGQPAQAVAAAREGLALAPKGSGVEYKLTAQEMRALASLGDRDGFTAARRRAERTYAKLPPAPHTPGKAFFAASTPCDHPHMLGTAMLLLGDWRTAERLKSEQFASEPEHDAPGRSISYLERGIARAHLGRLDEATADGMRALSSQRPAWSVLIQAGKLDQTLTKADATLPEVRDFHRRYLDARRALMQEKTASAHAHPTRR